MEKVSDLSALRKAHSYALANNMNISELMNIVARSSANGVDCLGTVDYDTLSVTFNKQIDSDIILDVFVNREMLDHVNTAMESNVFYNNDYALTPLLINVPNADNPEEVNQIKVRVYRFTDDDEMSSTDVDKMFRIQTIYGIGYIGLVQEGTNNASDVKICLGYNKYGNPIIRCLEKVE